jgi:hypothetical protein
VTVSATRVPFACILSAISPFIFGLFTVAEPCGGTYRPSPVTVRADPWTAVRAPAGFDPTRSLPANTHCYRCATCHHLFTRCCSLLLRIFSLLRGWLSRLSSTLWLHGVACGGLQTWRLSSALHIAVSASCLTGKQRQSGEVLADSCTAFRQNGITSGGTWRVAAAAKWRLRQ